MNYQQSLQRAIELGNKAVQAEKDADAMEKKEAGTGNFEEVLSLYMNALNVLFP